MKLRIQGDSLRLRLTRKEVASLNDQGFVECAIHFPDGRSLRYSIERGSALAVIYENDSIRVMLPENTAKHWAESDQVSVEGSVGDTHVLVEKDFQCLHAEKDRDPDAFPNLTERNQ